MKLASGIAGERALLPAEKVHRPTTALIAIMTFVILLAGAAGLALTNAAAAVTKGVDNRFVVELPAGIAGDLPRVVAAVRSVPGVRDANAVPEAEMRSTLQRWLGNAAAAQDLPVPALVTVELKAGVQPTALEAQVGHEFPGATVVAETAELGPLLESLHALQWLALLLVTLVAFATSAAVVLASRGALDTHRSTIEIMHGIGATDRQLTRLFERKIATDAMIGALTGTLAAAIGLLLVGGTRAVFASELTGGAPLGPGDIILLAVVPILVVILAMLVARWAILKALRETL